PFRRPPRGRSALAQIAASANRRGQPPWSAIAAEGWPPFFLLACVVDIDAGPCPLCLCQALLAQHPAAGELMLDAVDLLFLRRGLARLALLLGRLCRWGRGGD